MSMTGQLGLQGAAAAGALLLATLACMPVLQVPTVSNAAVAEEARRQRELAIELYHARRVRLAGVAAQGACVAHRHRRAGEADEKFSEEPQAAPPGGGALRISDKAIFSVSQKRVLFLGPFLALFLPQSFTEM